MDDGKEKKLELFSWRMNTSYNFANDKFPLANLSSSIRAKVAKKMNLDLSLSHDFYKFNHETGQRINSININENGIPTPRLINARLSTGFRFEGNRFGTKTDEKDRKEKQTERNHTSTNKNQTKKRRKRHTPTTPVAASAVADKKVVTKSSSDWFPLRAVLSYTIRITS